MHQLSLEGPCSGWLQALQAKPAQVEDRGEASCVSSKVN